MRDVIPMLFHRALRDGDRTEADLRDLVCHFTRVLRASGTPAERVIVELKHIMAGHAVDTGMRASALELQERMVSACIREYYGTAAKAAIAATATASTHEEPPAAPGVGERGEITA